MSIAVGAKVEIGSSTWLLEELLGTGGFARVYRAKSLDGSEAALKFVEKSPYAGRDLLVEDLTGAYNTVPTKLEGEYEGHWAIWMPLAEYSLRQHLTAVGRPLTWDEAKPVLQGVANALVGLRGEVVHRDIKPENILFWNGQWCLADFGIARYADKSTSDNTLKGSMSWHYASPEQWKHERATSASDVYQFGVVAYEILGGRRPFDGEDSETLRDQHLHLEPSAMNLGLDSLESLVLKCLEKAPGARPATSQLGERLAAVSPPANNTQSLLQSLNLQIQTENTARAAEIARAETERERRSLLYSAAMSQLQDMKKEMMSVFMSNLPDAGLSQWPIRLGPVLLDWGGVTRTQDHTLDGTAIPFDVIASTSIILTDSRGNRGYAGRSHSVWYCDAQDKGAYRWFELAFWPGAFTNSRTELTPFSLEPGRLASRAFSRTMGTEELARRVRGCDSDDFDPFVEFWTTKLVDAVAGKLTYPGSLPEESDIRSSYRDE